MKITHGNVWLSILLFIIFHNNPLKDSLPSFSGLEALVYLGHNNFTTIPHGCSSMHTLLDLGDSIMLMESEARHHREGSGRRKQSDVGLFDLQVAILFFIFKTFGDDYLLLSHLLSNSGNKKDVRMGWDRIGYRRRKIVSVDVENRSFTGTISPAFSNLTSRVNLTLAGNNLTGSIPHSLTTLRRRRRGFCDNNLSGQIPIKLINISKLVEGENATTSGDVRTSSSAKSRHRLYWIAGGSMFSVGFVVFTVLVICKTKRGLIYMQKWLFFKKTTKSTDHNVEDFMPIKQYRYSEIKRMTNSFQEKLGQGGYGVVYKASLPNGRQVAVKVINESKGNGEEFINEVASISRTSHVNIVSLLGFCCERKRALVYELMSKGSLDKFILKSGFPDAICSLDLNTLFQIIIGIARGLEYLHQGCNSKILHLDIKPQNILLDENFCPKISDFGLAKICQRNDTTVSIIGARGTIGYIAPEVFSRTNGGVSHKSDVYSYGMLILDTIGRRKNSDTRDSCTSEMYFPDWIYKELEQDNNLENCLANSEEEIDMVRKITMVSLWCIQRKPSYRPSISKVIEMLQGPLESVPYPPKPFLYSPEIPLLQTSCVSSNNFLGTNSSTLSEIVSDK